MNKTIQTLKENEKKAPRTVSIAYWKKKNAQISKDKAKLKEKNAILAKHNKLLMEKNTILNNKLNYLSEEYNKECAEKLALAENFRTLAEKELTEILQQYNYYKSML